MTTNGDAVKGELQVRARARETDSPGEFDIKKNASEIFTLYTGKPEVFARGILDVSNPDRTGPCVWRIGFGSRRGTIWRKAQLKTDCKTTVNKIYNRRWNCFERL